MPRPLLTMSATMTRLFCVTVIAIVAAGVLIRAMFHSSISILYCHLWKEKGCLRSVSMLVDGEIMGSLGPEYKQIPVFIVFSPVFPRKAGWEMAERKTKLSHPGLAIQGQLKRDRLCIKGCP